MMLTFTREEDMAAFDALPAPFRAVIRESDLQPPAYPFYWLINEMERCGVAQTTTMQIIVKAFEAREIENFTNMIIMRPEYVVLSLCDKLGVRPRVAYGSDEWRGSVGPDGRWRKPY